MPAEASTAAGGDRRTLAAVPAAPWVVRYVSFLGSRVGLAVVLLFWAAVIGAGAYGALQTFASLRMQLDPFPGDANDLAAQALAAAFPGSSHDTLLVVVELRSADGSNITLSARARAAEHRLAAFAQPYLAMGLVSAGSAEGYFQLSELGLPSLAAHAVSINSSAVAVPFYSDEGGVTARAKEFLLSLRRTLREIERESNGTLIAADAGWLPLTYDSSTAILRELVVSDAATVSLSFIVFALVLGSPRLVGLTLVCLVASFCGAFLLLWPVAVTLATPNFATSVVTCTLVSLSLDYSLFLLTYARECVLSVGDALTLAAVAQMLSLPGHTVLVSGSTLCACFLVLAVYPIDIVRVPGIAASFAVLMSVRARREERSFERPYSISSPPVVTQLITNRFFGLCAQVLSNLTLIPALLLACPGFFSASCSPCGGGVCLRRRASFLTMPAAAGSSLSGRPPPAAEENSSDEEAPATPRQQDGAAAAAGGSNSRGSSLHSSSSPTASAPAAADSARVLLVDDDDGGGARRCGPTRGALILQVCAAGEQQPQQLWPVVAAGEQQQLAAAATARPSDLTSSKREEGEEKQQQQLGKKVQTQERKDKQSLQLRQRQQGKTDTALLAGVQRNEGSDSSCSPASPPPPPPSSPPPSPRGDRRARSSCCGSGRLSSLSERTWAARPGPLHAPFRPPADRAPPRCDGRPLRVPLRQLPRRAVDVAAQHGPEGPVQRRDHVRNGGALRPRARSECSPAGRVAERRPGCPLGRLLRLCDGGDVLRSGRQRRRRAAPLRRKHRRAQRRRRRRIARA